MPHYLFQAEFTAVTKHAMIDNPTNREEAAKPVLEAVGGKMIRYYCSADMTRLFALFEAPDDTASAAVALAVGATGGFTATSITKVLTASEAMEPLAKARLAASAYVPPAG